MDKDMISLIVLTNLRGVEVALNPDTTIMLTNGALHIVRESRDEVIQRTVNYKRRIFNPDPEPGPDFD